VPVLDVVPEYNGLELRLPAENEVVSDPKKLTDVLETFLRETLVDTIEEVSEWVALPVEGFLRVMARTTSRDDVMFEVPPDVQERLAKAVERNDSDFDCELKIADFPGAGRVVRDTRYQVLESAGYGVEEPAVEEQPRGLFKVSGRPIRIE
jgi:hypothetical protein